MRRHANVSGLMLLGALSGPAAVADDLEARTEAASPVQADRLEFITKDRAQFHVIPLGENGFLVAYAEDTPDGARSWVVRCYDATFQERWSTAHTGHRKQYLRGRGVDSDTGYLLLVRDRLGGDEFELIKLNRDSGALEVTRGSFPAKFHLAAFNKFKVNKTLAWLAGSVKKEALVLAVEVDGGAVRRFPIALNGRSAVKSISVDEQSDHVNVVAHNLLNKKNTLVIFDYFGTAEELERSPPAAEDASHQLTDARLHQGDDGQTIMIGTYTLFERRRGLAALSHKPRWGVQGLFFAKLNPHGQSFVKYHSFSEFENFFDYLSERKQRRKKGKLARRKKSGSEPKLDYQLVLHDPVRLGEAYIMVGEVFKPVSTTSTHTSPTTGALKVETTYVGDLYSHAVVAAFDEDGERIWDHCLEMDVMLDLSRKHPGASVLIGAKRIAVGLRDGELHVVHFDENAIESLTIRAGVAPDELVLTEIESGGTEKGVKSGIGRAEYWYGNDFLVWGLQRFEKDRLIEIRQETFFVSRVSY